MTVARGRAQYLPGDEPTFWSPNPASPTHRFVLGRLPAAGVPLVAIGMNPSHASEQHSDRTVNRIIQASKDLGYSGWVMLNLYPERASSPSSLHGFDQSLSDKNCDAIERFFQQHGAGEALAAWGNPPNATIARAKGDLLAVLKRLGVNLFYFGSLTTYSEPRHPNPRGRAYDTTGAKLYLLP